MTECFKALKLDQISCKMSYNLVINTLFQHFEALWPKILPPDLKTFVYFFFAHPLHK